MRITDAQIDFIRGEMQKNGVHDPDLLNSLTDHICCILEQEQAGADFMEAYTNALELFGDNGLIKVQYETDLINLKKEITMKKIIYVVGCLAAILIVNGILFKVFHWNGANIMLLSGVVLLNIVLPIYFYDTYKKVIPKRS